MSIPCKMQTEELLPWFGWSADCTVYEGGMPPGGLPTSIIRTDQPWAVCFKWTTTCPLNYLMCGKWKLEVHLEQMGGGEYSLPKATADVEFVSKPHEYKKCISTS